MNTKTISPQREVWLRAMQNLMNRRAVGGNRLGTQGDSIEARKIRDYRGHLEKVFIGDSLLDVGCGDMSIARHLKDEVDYTGIDAFPVSPAVIKMEVEEMNFEDEAFDTVICFAVLDGVCDLEKALTQMARVCRKNIVFLTGIGIEPDQYHTYKITEHILVQNLPGFKLGYSEFFTHNVALLEFKKI